MVMPAGPPPELAQMLSQQMGGGGAPPAGGGGQPDQLEAVQEVIQSLHELLVTLTDPSHVQNATKCLGVMTGIQKELMGQPGGQAPGY